MKSNDCLTFSPLCQKVDLNGRQIDLLIYKDLDREWYLEIVDDLGTSIVCDQSFPSDQLALEYSAQMIEAISRL